MSSEGDEAPARSPSAADLMRTRLTPDDETSAAAVAAFEGPCSDSRTALRPTFGSQARSLTQMALMIRTPARSSTRAWGETRTVRSSAAPILSRPNCATSWHSQAQELGGPRRPARRANRCRVGRVRHVTADLEAASAELMEVVKILQHVL